MYTICIQGVCFLLTIDAATDEVEVRLRVEWGSKQLCRQRHAILGRLKMELLRIARTIIYYFACDEWRLMYVTSYRLVHARIIVRALSLLLNSHLNKASRNAVTLVTVVRRK